MRALVAAAAMTIGSFAFQLGLQAGWFNGLTWAAPWAWGASSALWLWWIVTHPRIEDEWLKSLHVRLGKSIHLIRLALCLVILLCVGFGVRALVKRAQKPIAANVSTEGEQSKVSSPPQPVNTTETPTPAPRLRSNHINTLATSKTVQSQIEQHGTDSGAVVGNITTGPCSNVQIGGSSNQAQTNCVPEMRRLTDQEKAQLSSLANTPVDLIVWANGGDKKAWDLGQDICSALRSASWRIQAPECVEAMIGPPLGGGVDMAIFINPVEIEQIDATQMRIHILGVSQLVQMLRSFGLSVGIAPSEKVPPKFVKIVMG
jgi:hypothetical protein